MTTETKPRPVKRGGLYYVRDDPADPTKERALISVTDVLDKTVAKPALQYWAAKQAAAYALEHPDASLSEASGAANRSKGTAGARGGTIHEWAQAIIEGSKLPEVKPEWQGFVKALDGWLASMSFEFTHVEQVIANMTEGYAGRTDGMGKLVKRFGLIDFKTAKAVYPDMRVQLSAYEHGEVLIDEFGLVIDDMPPLDFRAIVHLQSSGQWAWHEMPDGWNAFRAYLHLYRDLDGLVCPPACWCGTEDPRDEILREQLEESLEADKPPELALVQDPGADQQGG